MLSRVHPIDFFHQAHKRHLSIGGNQQDTLQTHEGCSKFAFMAVVWKCLKHKLIDFFLPLDLLFNDPSWAVTKHPSVSRDRKELNERQMNLEKETSVYNKKNRNKQHTYIYI